jgi:hypothetical protein
MWQMMYGFIATLLGVQETNSPSRGKIRGQTGRLPRLQHCSILIESGADHLDGIASE